MKLNLPTMGAVNAKPHAKPKGPTRLQESVAKAKLTTVTEKDFKREVRERDKWHCRKCLRHVEVLMSRVPERAEVHHIHGRGKDLRFEARAALLLCLQCHEQVTGRVNEKWAIKGSRTFTMRDREYIDARFAVEFVKL